MSNEDNAQKVDTNLPKNITRGLSAVGSPARLLGSGIKIPNPEHPLPTPSPSNEEVIPCERAGIPNDTAPTESSQESFATSNHRSLILKGIPKSASLKDITKTIRGGAILNLFQRRQHGVAYVAFVEASAAEEFESYARNTQLVIKGKAVTVSWDQKQYCMFGGLARNVYQNGATRNLVIRFPKPEVTGEVIREDLEHIHSLEIVDTMLKDGHAWISLNSVRHALTARACMSSRLRYKGSPIEFWPDECASAIPGGPLRPHRVQAVMQSKQATPFSNRYSMLAKN